MSSQICINAALTDYIAQVTVREEPVLVELREETSRLDKAVMQIGPEQGQFMALLLKLMGAKRCMEVGTFTGYSALVCALALPDDGQVIALDISEEWTKVAQRYWQKAGVAERVDLRLGDAAETMRNMLPEERGSVDFLFIDADKVAYQEYVDLGYELLRPGGLIALDNVLWDGAVIDEADASDDTVALRKLNESMLQDERFDISMALVGDGLTLARKR